tara:strand:+ start:1266 stop:1817 length:552 start_codon:yes stop_codon:yes gene_type:complete
MKKILLLGTLSILLSGCSSMDWLGDYSSNSSDKKEEKKEIQQKTIDSEKTEIKSTNNILVPSTHFLMHSNWKLESVNGKSINPDYHITIHFKNNLYSEHDLLISGKSGCNSYQTTGSVLPLQSKMEVSEQVLSTKMYCADPNLRALEKLFLKVLKDNKKIERHSDKVLYLKHYNEELKFKKVN